MAVRAGYEQAPGEGFDVYQGQSGAGITQDRLFEELGKDGFENFFDKLGKNIFDSKDPNNGLGTIGSFTLGPGMLLGIGPSLFNGAVENIFGGGGLGSGNIMMQGNSPGYGNDFITGFASASTSLLAGVLRSFSADGTEIKQPQAGPSTPGFNPNENLAMNTTNNPTLSPGGPGTGMA